MIKINNIEEKDIKAFNQTVGHPLQSYEWGEFRKETGVKVIRRRFFKDEKLIAAFQITIHRVPYTKWSIGYLPKGTVPTPQILDELKKIGKEENCIFIQLEPNIKTAENLKSEIENLGLRLSFHPLFTKFTFQLDLTKTEEELLEAMHPKTRYNIKIAQKYGVKIVEDNSNDAFETYLKLTSETTKRQGFYAHSKKYHQQMWKALKDQGSKKKDQKPDTNILTAHLLLAKYKAKTCDKKLTILAAWIVFVFKDTLYYPYGASSREYRETMASNLMMWEVINFGRKQGLKKFDMWGSLGPVPDKNDEWYGFHRFKQGYGPELVEFIGSYDLIIKPWLYKLYKLADLSRWGILRLKTTVRKRS